MTLEVDIYGRNMEITDRIQDFVTKKVSKLDRYLPGIEEAAHNLASLYAEVKHKSLLFHISLPTSSTNDLPPPTPLSQTGSTSSP